MYAQVLSAVMLGLSVCPIRIEADVSSGLPGLHLIGYLGSDVREAGERVRTALHNSGYSLPAKRMTINLAPADLRKSGALFDLPIAAALAAAAGYIPSKPLSDILILGEVGLNGEIGPVRGILSMVRYARKAGLSCCIVPMDNEAEARLVNGISIIGVSSINDVFRYVKEGHLPEEREAEEKNEGKVNVEEFSDIRGQETMKRVSVIAAAGFHNLLMTGPPGAGKTMAARRIPGIMPPLTREESLSLTEIYSIVGELKKDVPLITVRPFRAPHHTVTQAALIGGGAVPVPGEITLSHNGVLFLDEFGEYSRNVLELLRQPLEDHTICLTRSRGRFVYPADFLLVAAMNPCPCGYFPDVRCTCTDHELHRYHARLSRPLLDRIDLFLRLEAVKADAILREETSKQELTSAQMRKMVMEAWKRQQARYAGGSFRFNGRIPSSEIEKTCALDASGRKLARTAFDKLGLSVRAWHRSLRVARTIADLDGEEQIREEHLIEALGYRMLQDYIG